jgi:hypothetical protein
MPNDSQPSAVPAANPGRPARRPRRLATLLLLLISIGVTLLGAEGVFRLCAHKLAGNGEWFAAGHIIRDDDPLLGFSLLPGTTQLAVRGGAYTVRTSINALGMRDVEHPAEPRADRRRVLLLGDSFMFSPGVTLAHSMPRRLEEMLPGTEVLNAGVPGFNLEQEYLYLSHQGLKLQPAVIVQCFFINDLAPAPDFEITRDASGLPLSYVARKEGRPPRTAAGLRGRVTSWLNTHSLLYVFARTRLTRPPREKSAVQTGRPTAPSLPPEVEAFRSGETPPEAWQQAWRVMDAMRAAAAARGAVYAVVMIPAPFQKSFDAGWLEWVRWLDVPPDSLDRLGPQRRLEAWCAASGTPCLDLFGTFADLPIDQTFIPHDLHWTADGHERAARAVADFLKSRGLAGA